MIPIIGMMVKEIWKELPKELRREADREWFTTETKKVYYYQPSVFFDPWEWRERYYAYFKDKENWEVDIPEDEYESGTWFIAKHKDLPVEIEVVEDGVHVVVETKNLKGVS